MRFDIPGGRGGAGMGRRVAVDGDSAGVSRRSRDAGRVLCAYAGHAEAAPRRCRHLSSLSSAFRRFKAA